MITKTGGWAFTKAYDCIYDRLSSREAMVLFALQRKAARAHQRGNFIKWDGKEYCLSKNEYRLVLRELAGELSLPRMTLSRIIDALIEKQVIRLIKRSKANGSLIYVCEPDDIPSLATKRFSRLGQVCEAVRLEYQRTKSADLKKRWDKLRQDLGQLAAKLTSYSQMSFPGISKDTGTDLGTLEVLNTRINALEENSGATSAPEKVLEASDGAPSAPKDEGGKVLDQSNGAPVGAPSEHETRPVSPVWQAFVDRANAREKTEEAGWRGPDAASELNPKS